MNLDIDEERAWLAGTVGLVSALVVGSVAFPRRVYASFVWQYFWGPVYADANGAACAQWAGGARQLLGRAECASPTGIVAYPGYTVVSEVGYMLVLLLMLGGVILLVRRLGVGTDKRLFYGLLPFMFLGGALRVVEDANDAVPVGVDPLVSYPWNSLLISPVIYFTLFAVTLVALVGSVRLARSGRVTSYERPLAVAGGVLLAATLGYLLLLGVTESYVDLFPQVTLLTLLVATVATLAVGAVVRRVAPQVNSGTGLAGAVVIWGHAVDGAANVLLLDWSLALGLGIDYSPKHPANAAVVGVTEAVVPETVTAVVGTAWPFLLVKLLAATGAVWLFDDRIFEESPRYAVLLLVAVLAVGLGPGTRDMLRATFGV
jgi:uncharacterized membrane protein